MVRASAGFARRYVVFVLIATLLVCACGARAVRGSAQAATPHVVCDLYASPNGQAELAQSQRARAGHRHHGTLAHPFASVQGLLKALRPGLTGCLEPGTYDVGSELRIGRSGRPKAPVTLAADPSRHATLTGGYVEIAHGSNYMVLRGLRIRTNGNGVGQPGVQILGSHDALMYSNISNHNTKGSCIILGSDTGWGEASHTLIAGDVVHQCGHSPGNAYQDHGVYVDNSVDATIQNSTFWGIPDGWGIQLYPHSVGTRVLHNVIVDNGRGVVFGGNTSYTSSGNLVAYNVISDAWRGFDVESYWASTVGSHNVAEYNCLYSGHSDEIQRPTKGFTALHNRIVQPQFVRPAHHDYALKSDSPCRSMIG